MKVRVGVISDTHGLLRPEALRALAGSDHIVHAGDIGSPDILAALAAMAPVTAVRGNNDVDAWAANLPDQATLRLLQVTILVLHDLHALAPGALEPRPTVVIAGHSHRPRIARGGDGVLFFNPGSAGPRRFSLPVALGHLDIEGTEISPRIEELTIATAKPVRTRRARA